MTDNPRVLSMEEVREIGERAAKATPGPWVSGGLGYSSEPDDVEMGYVRSPAQSALDVMTEGPDIACVVGTELAAFIAHARTDIPNLLATIEAQAKVVEAVREKQRLFLMSVEELEAEFDNWQDAVMQADVAVIEALSRLDTPTPRPAGN